MRGSEPKLIAAILVVAGKILTHLGLHGTDTGADASSWAAAASDS